MSSEVCPFCGKTYKRLKSHLPHCKAAVSSKTPPTKPDVTVNQTTASSLLAADSSEPTAKGKKATQTLPGTASTKAKKKERVSVESSAPPLQGADASYTSRSSVLPSSSTKKKKQKLSEQIKTAKMASSTSFISSPSLSPSPIISEPKKKSLRALIEATQSKQVPTGSMEGTRSASEDLSSNSNPFVADSQGSRTKIVTQTKTNSDKDLVKDNTHVVFPSTDIKPQGASQKKASKTKKAAQSHLTTKDTSLDSKLNNSRARLQVRDNFRVENEGEVADFSVNNSFLKSGSGRQARITLQDVKATLGRANGNRQPNRLSILSQIDTTEVLSSKITPTLPTKNQESSLITAKTQSDQTELQSVKRKTSKTSQASLIPLQRDVSLQPELTTSKASILSGHLSSQVSQATPPPHAVSMEGLKAGQHQTGILAISPSLIQFSSPHTLRLTSQTLLAPGETLRADDGSQLEIRRQNTADNGLKGALTERSLGQVRLRELPEWLACKTPSHPRDVVQMVQSGWQWYYKKYIDVKKGGVGGVGMLLAGYCVLSYMWSYPHIKRDRWRKHH
uniref:mitochondrial nucleoid-associated protein 1 n=1 Tax=Semicossyphus pulcher TaxID=241346 RepID=UPI0037E7467F